MSKEVIRVDFDELEKIAGRFAQRSDATAEMHGAVLRAFEQLQNGGWAGRGSESFTAEMEGEVIPAIRRLIAALAEAAAVTRQLGEIYQAAQEEGAQGFNTGGSGGRDLGSRLAGALAIDPSVLLGLTGGGSWSGDGSGFRPLDAQIASVRELAQELGLLPNGPFPGGGGTPPGSSEIFPLPEDWLAGVNGSLQGTIAGEFNEYGIPQDWLDGVLSGSGSPNDYGIPQDWLAGVTEGGGGASGGSGGSGGPTETTGGGGSSGGGTGGGSGGGTGGDRPSDRGARFATPSDFRGGGGTAGGVGKAEPASGPLRYQPSGGGGSAAPAAAPQKALLFPAAAGSGASAAAGGGGPQLASLGIAAVSPFVAMLGKAILGDRKKD